MIRAENFVLTEIAPGVWQGKEYRCDDVYIVIGEEKAALIDTGSGTCNMDKVVRAVTDLPYVVLLTHCHRDHVGGCRQFPQAYLHPADREKAETVTLEMRRDYVMARMQDEAFVERIFSLMPPDGDFPQWLDYPDVIDLGGRTLEVLHTPGHTAGSISLLDKTSHTLFIGDTLTGGTLIVMPGEDRKAVVKTWLDAMKKLKSLARWYYTIASGHGFLEFEHMDTIMDMAEAYVRGELEPEFVCKPTFHSLQLKRDGKKIEIQRTYL